MGLYNVLNAILNAYANKINSHTNEISELGESVEELSRVATNSRNGLMSAEDKSTLDTLNSSGLSIKDSVIQGKVEDWLLAHPDATTTIQDGSVTESKVAGAYKEKIVRTYDSVSDMIADSNIQSGMYAITKGYSGAGDGGHSTYRITDSEISEDGGAYIALNNGLTAVCNADCIPYPTYTKIGRTAHLYNLTADSDISTVLNTVLSIDDIDIVSVPDGSFIIGSTVTIPDGKTLRFAGDYKNPSISPTNISPVSSGYSMIKIGSQSHLSGGVFDLGSNENIICVEISCYKKAVRNSDVRGTKIIGGRERSPHVFSQTAVFVNCDYPDGETVTGYGYLMYCEFDAYITGVGSAYHFKRLTSPATTSGVWLTQNDIHGYIHHCTHYIWYDFVSGSYANNDSIIDATLQSGSLYSGEATYPGINIWGSGILITGKLWDFDSTRAKPAVYFEEGATGNIILRRCTVNGHDLKNGATTQNISHSMLQSLNNYKKIGVAIYSDNNFDASEYVYDLTNNSYIIGDIIYFNISFKVRQEIPKDSNLFTISNADAFVSPYIIQITTSSQGNEVGRAFVDASNPHVITLRTTVAFSSAWLNVTGTFVLNRIKTRSY